MNDAFKMVCRYVASRFDRFAQCPYLLGSCNICGNDVAFFTESVQMYRELLKCSECGATSRYRAIAKGVLRAIYELVGVRASSVAELAKLKSARQLTVYDTQPPFYFDNLAYPLPDMLKAVPWIDVQCSSLDPYRPLGERLGPMTTNQNLEGLTFADRSFDILITSDVMEHVRLAERAHAEISRVVKPGGVYVFTVPTIRARYETEIRVEIVDPEDPNKDIIHQLEYHGDHNNPEGRALTYRSYGSCLDDELKALGFEVHFEMNNLPEAGIMQTELFYCRRRLGPARP
jgi:SAM-dependent methyltransferase